MATKLHDLFITWSCDKYKTLYLHFCSTYDHKTGQSITCGVGTQPSNSRDLMIMRSRKK